MSKNKTKKGKLPKRIAGIKLPKEARKRAEKAIAELKQPIVREMIAGAVCIAATAMAKQAATMRNGQRCTPAAHPEPKPDSAMEANKPAGKSGGEQFAEIATGLAVAGLGKFFEKMHAVSEATKEAQTP